MRWVENRIRTDNFLERASWSVAGTYFCYEITLGTVAPYLRNYSLAEVVVLWKYFGPQQSVRRMFGPGDHSSFIAQTSTVVSAALKYGRTFTYFPRGSWTHYLSSALKIRNRFCSGLQHAKRRLLSAHRGGRRRHLSADSISSMPAPEFSASMIQL